MKRDIYFPLLILILLVPAGLIAENPAWGEWDTSFFEKTVGYVPEGIGKTVSIVKPVIPDYSLPGLSPVLSYYISAIAGSLLLFLFFYFVHIASKRIKL